MFILYNIHIYSGSWRKSSVKLRCILLFLKLNSMYSFDLKFEYINWLLIHRTIYHYYAVSFVRWKFPFLCKEDIRFRNAWNSQSRKLTIMLLLWFVLILSVKKRWCATEFSMIVSMFLSLPHCALDIFATGKCVNHGGECKLEIPPNFHLHGPEKAIKLAKK